MQKGIILNSIDYKENSKIIYILTPEGKSSALTLKAKKINNSYVNETQNFNIVEFDLIGKGNLKKLNTINVIDYNYAIKEDIKKTALVSYAVELVYRFIAEANNYDTLYSLIIKFMEMVKLRDDYKMMLLEFKIKMLYFLGINPSFNHCVFCGKKDNIAGLSITSGGVECMEHKSIDNIGMDATNIIKLLYFDKSFEIKMEDQEIVNYIYDLIEQYYEKHFSENLKANKLLQDLKII